MVDFAKAGNYGTSGLQPRGTKTGGATLAQEQETSGAFNMRERVDPRFIQFGDGESVQGILHRIEMVEVTKDGQTKKVPRLVVEELESREMVCFLATYQVASKIRRGDVGHVIDVRCEGNDPTIKTKGQPMKKFRVLVSEGMAPGFATDGTLITDDDIPDVLR
jgi:hypothetical protein